jgi:hypothetical protein
VCTRGCLTQSGFLLYSQGLGSDAGKVCGARNCQIPRPCGSALPLPLSSWEVSPPGEFWCAIWHHAERPVPLDLDSPPAPALSAQKHLAVGLSEYWSFLQFNCYFSSVVTTYRATKQQTVPHNDTEPPFPFSQAPSPSWSG